MSDVGAAPLCFRELSERHGALLEAQADEHLDPAAAARFVADAAAAGVQIESVSDRDAVRSMINYWTSVLARLPKAKDAPAVVAPVLTGRTMPPTGPIATLPPRARLAAFDATKSPDLSDEANPFVGLSAFDQGQAKLFFGRDHVILDLLNTVVGSSLVVVTGASGTGKSSLVKAGLTAAVRADPRYTEWTICTTAPGRDPLASVIAALAPDGTDSSAWIDQARRRVDADPSALAGIAGERMGQGSLLLAMDQFEEIFSLCAEGPRDQVAIGLAAVANLPRAHIVVTIRDEYLEGERARHVLPDVFDIGAATEFRIPPLTPAEIRETITGPAARVGLVFQDGLVDRIVSDVGTDPAALPLLQYTLLRLWQKRQGNRITNETYDQVGCLGSSLSNAAQEIYDGLGTEQAQNNVRTVFEQLVRPSLAYEFVRDRVTRGELQTLLSPDTLNTVLTPFENASLIRITRAADRNEDRIEIVHEALIRNWDLLRRWSLESREKERAYLSLDAQAAQWADSGKVFGNLLFGRALIDAERVRIAYDEKRIRSDPVAKARVDKFLAASRSRQRSLLWILATVVATALLVIATLAYVNRRTQEQDESKGAQLVGAQDEIAEQRARLVAQGGPLVGESARQFIQMLLSRGTISTNELPIEFDDMTPTARPWPIAQAGAGYDRKFLPLDVDIVPKSRSADVRTIDLPNARIVYDTATGTPLVVVSQSDRSQLQTNQAPNGLYAYPGLAGQPDEPLLARRGVVLGHLVDRRETGWGPKDDWAASATNLLPMLARMPQRLRQNTAFAAWLKLGQWMRGKHDPTASRVVYLTGAVAAPGPETRLLPAARLWKIGVSVDSAGKVAVDAAMLPTRAKSNQGDLPGRTTVQAIAAASGLDFSALIAAQQRGVRNIASAPAASSVSQAGAPARIYTHVNNVPSDKAAALVLALSKDGFRTPPIQQVDACVAQPQLRYYYDADRAGAERAAASAIAAIGALGLDDRKLRIIQLDLKQYSAARPGNFELWLCGSPPP